MARARPHTNTWLEFLLTAIANHTLLLFASDLACKRDKASWCWSWFARLLVCFKCFLILFIKVWILAKRHQGEILSDRSALTGTCGCMCTHTHALTFDCHVAVCRPTSLCFTDQQHHATVKAISSNAHLLTRTCHLSGHQKKTVQLFLFFF